MGKRKGYGFVESPKNMIGLSYFEARGLHTDSCGKLWLAEHDTEERKT